MATNTVPTFTNHTGNGTAGPFNIGFNYIDKNEVIVRVNEVLKSTPTHYTFTSNTQITFTSGNEPASGLNIEFRRSTNITTAKVDFQDGSVLTETDLDANTNQLLFALQENTDAVNADNLESSNIYLRDGSRTLTGSIVFEGSTKDAHETTLTPIDPTADRTINIPNVSGTLVTTGDTGTITSAMIADGTFVNADINANAAIAGTKVSPNFGSQNISTTGNVTATNFIGNGSQLTGITFTGIDQFLRRDIDDTASGNITFNKNIFIPNHAGTSNVFNDSDVLDTGNLIFGPTPDTTSSDPMQFNNYIYHSTLNSNTEPTTVLQLGTTSSSSTRFGSFTIKGNNETLVTFTKEFGSFFEEKINIPHTNTEGIIFSNHSINNNPKIPSLQIKSNDPSSNTPDSFINCKRGNLNIACGVNGTGTVIKDVDTNGPNTIAVFKSDIGNNSGDAFHKGAVELYSEGTKRFETNSTGAKVSGTLEIIAGTTTPEILFAGAGPNIIRFSSNDAPTDNTDDIDLIYRSTPNTLGFERVSDSAELFLVDADTQEVKIPTATGKLQLNTHLNIYRDANHAYIDHASGALKIRSDTLRINDLTNDHSMIHADADDAVKLYYDNVKKAETSADGLNITNSRLLVYNSTAPQVRLNTSSSDSSSTRFMFGLATASNQFINGASSNDSCFSAPSNILFGVGNSRKFRIKANDVLTDVDFIPSANDARSLGRSDARWSDLFAVDANISGNLTISSTNPQLIFDQTSFNNKYKIEESSGQLKVRISNNGGTTYYDSIKIGGVGNIFIPDNDELIFGTGQDLSIVHDGTDSKITNKTGNLLIEAKDAETGIKVIPDDAVELYFDASKKLSTKSWGSHVFGALVANGDLKANTYTGKLKIGESDEFTIQHDDTDTFITNTAGNLHIRPKDDEEGIKLNPDGGVLLYHDNALKFQTTANGWRCDDNVKGLFGTSGDLAIYHDGSNSIIQDNGAGELLFNRGSNTILSLNDLGIEVTDPNGTAVVSIKGFEGNNARLELKADEGDDAGDTWRIQSQANDNDLEIFNNTSGVNTYSTKWRLNTAGTVIQTGGLKLPDNAMVMLGGGADNSGDLQIYHNGSNTFIDNSTGVTNIRGGTHKFRKLSDNEDMLILNPNSAVELYFDNVKRFETLSTGTKSTGNTHTFLGGGSDVSLTVATSATSSATTTLELRGSRTSSTTVAISKIDFTTADNANTSVYDSTMPLGSIKMFKQQGNTNRGRLKIDLNNVSGDNSATVFDLESDGDLTIAGTLTQNSDKRLKTDIVTISDALTKVNNLRGVEYTRIASGEKEIGVIAQEVQTVFPELVRTGDDEDKTLSVNYGHLTAALIEAIKELSAKLKVLESNI